MSETTPSARSRIVIGESGQTLAELLAANLGRAVAAEFELAGQLVAKTGVLTAASGGYLVLNDDVNHTDVVCETDGLRFVTFYLEGIRPDAGTQNRTEEETPGVTGITAVSASRAQAQAALNYTRRKARKLE